MIKNKTKNYEWLLFIFAWLLAFTFCLLTLPGCGTTVKSDILKFNMNDVYRRDLKVKINGKEFTGAGVVPRADKYEIEIDPPGKIDRIMWQTCNRDEVIDSPDSSFFSKKFKFSFQPVKLEDTSSCGGLTITVLEEKKRRNGFAFLDFQDKREEVSVPVVLTCNGVVESHTGVSVCQSAAGLFQEMIFNEPVKQAGAVGECDVMSPFNGNEQIYRFQMPKGECTYYFVAQSRAPNGERKLHRLTTIGYTDVLPIKE